MKGYIRKRGNKWSYTVDIGRDPQTGKRKQKSQSGFKTKKEAQAALAELVNDVEKGNYHEPEKQKFKDFVLEYYKNTYINRVKPSSYEAAYRIAVNHIIPYFNNTDMNNIDQFSVHQFYNDKIKEGLSSYTIHNIHIQMRMLLRVAKKWKVLKEDIASMLEPPKLIKKEMNVWTIEEVNTFLTFTQKSRYHPVFFLAAYTGMRKGEILGLTWEDVDFAEKTISVNKTLFRGTNESILQSPKTRSSNRAIYMDDDIIRVLKKQKVNQNLERLKYGGVYKEHNMVFAQETGDFVNPNAVSNMFTRFIEQAGLPKIRFHDLRHTHATLLLEMKKNPKIVAERLGHSTVATTLDVYSHVGHAVKKEVSEQFAEMMKSGQNVSNSQSKGSKTL
jgi:integrase